MATYANMGPFSPASFKGNAKIHGVPTFVDKLPLTIGGIAGDDLKFGRVVSIDPTDNRRAFKPGVDSNYIVKGITMLDPTIMRADPAMNDYYFTGKPCTVVTFGLVDILEYDLTKSAPCEGSTVWCRNSDGVIAFNDGTNIAASGYTKLNAFVYETLDPNGAKVFFNLPFVAGQTAETLSTVATPTASPAAGSVTSGTEVSLSTTTVGATIYYTVDGTTPTMESDVFDKPIVVTASVTVKAIAVKEGMNPSSMLTAAYTVS